MKIKEILAFLDSFCPVNTACEFDNVGLLVGNKNADVKRVLVALDCTMETLSEAAEKSCELIITHHPVIFSPLKRVTDESIVFELIRRGIAVISMHTNLDMAIGGVNSCLCEKIGLEKVKTHTASDGYILQCGEISPIGAQEFALQLKAKLGGVVKFVDGKKTIKNVLVCSGSGGDFIAEAINGGFDALVTADIKHHQFLTAFDNGVSLFDCGHFNTEDVVVSPLKAKLSAEFPNIEFIESHTTNIKYI
ncbi:MAG: Nif3-like dinuclear metal center hexameric protein [Ruminococcaceae bacterium]|nr:Nif3-like dinuclear metal center hexameric protein [Oscillospiraceae bacterium]